MRYICSNKLLGIFWVLFVLVCSANRLLLQKSQLGNPKVTRKINLHSLQLIGQGTVIAYDRKEMKSSSQVQPQNQNHIFSTFKFVPNLGRVQRTPGQLWCTLILVCSSCRVSPAPVSRKEKQNSTRSTVLFILIHILFIIHLHFKLTFMTRHIIFSVLHITKTLRDYFVRSCPGI